MRNSSSAKMRKRKCYLLTSFSLMCVFLYFSHYYLNSINSWDCCQFIFGDKERRVIPSIVVYSSAKENKKCIPFNDIPNVKAEWQKVSDSHLYVYSAYLDDRLGNGNRFVRIIAMSKGKFSQKAFCRIWNQDQNSYANEIDVQELWVTSWDLASPEQYYRPLLLSCEVEKDTLPLAVSVTTELCQKPDNVLWLNKIKTSGPQKDFVVCLKPLNFKDDVTAKLLEWLEFQFILGADKIAVYVYNLPFQALYVLNSYEKLGRIIIKYPTLPFKQNETEQTSSEQKVWQKRRYEMVIYNDCFYSHIGSHKFVINLDLDEVIVPRRQDSWMAMLKQAAEKTHNLYRFASISAANVYYFESFGTDPDGTIPQYLYMLRHTYRSANFTPPGFAQKSFFLTNSTLSVTNHYALKTLYPHVRTNTALGKDLAQLHHYRKGCPPKMEQECRNNYMKYKIKDPIILKFKDRLIENISRKVKELNLTNLLIGNDPESKSS